MSSEMKKQPTQIRRPGGFGPHGGGAGEKPKDLKRALKNLGGSLKGSLPSFILIFIMALGGTILSIMTPKIMGEAISYLFAAFMPPATGMAAVVDKIYTLLFTCICLYVVSAVLSFVANFIMAGTAQRITYNMRRQVSEKLTRLPLKYHDAHTHGEILSRITNDIDTVGNSLSQAAVHLVQGVTTVIGAFIMMLTISGWLTLIAVVILPISMLLIGIIMKHSQKYFRANQERLGNINSHIEEMYAGHKVVKAYSYEDESIKTFSHANDELYRVGWKSQFFGGVAQPIMNFVSNIGYVAISVVGMMFVIKQTGGWGSALEPGNVTSFVQYSNMFTQQLTQASQLVVVLQTAAAASERVYEVLQEDEQTPDSDTEQLPEHVRGEITFEDVSFGYTPEKTLIRNMNLSVKPGELVAIVGPTGAGKTTIVNLLMRFYDVNAGRILIDGVDINNVSRERLRDKIGMVLQDTWLFHGSIADNISYSKLDATREEVQSAAYQAQAHRFIKTLAHGYDTVVNEEAGNISQGQKQLLTIARALLADPEILILDEATSSVDTMTELHIQKAMKTLMEGRTSFVIAHRLSTIKDADKILVMVAGNIVEQGTHDELLAVQGVYADLYNSQFAN